MKSALWRGLARWQRLDSLYLLAGQPLLVPYYHTVSDDTMPHIAPLYPFKGVMAFEQDLEALLVHFTPISLEELLAHLRTGARLPAWPMLLTFDDGLRECHAHIAPMLLRKGVPAAFFLCPAFMDNAALMYRHQAGLLLHHLKAAPDKRPQVEACLRALGWGTLPPELAIKDMGYAQQDHLAQLAQVLEVDFADFLSTQQPYMTWEQAGTLRQWGFDLGAHSWDHPRLQDLPLDERMDQMRRSLDAVQTLLDLPYRAFAFPFSDVGISRSFMRQLVHGMAPVADITFGTSGIRRDVHPRVIQRVDLETIATPAVLQVKTLLLKYLVRKLLRRTHLPRKR